MHADLESGLSAPRFAPAAASVTLPRPFLFLHLCLLALRPCCHVRRLWLQALASQVPRASFADLEANEVAEPRGN